MKRILPLLLLSAFALTGCKAFRSLDGMRSTAQGSPYEVVVVCPNAGWESPLGDTIRSILTRPVEVTNQYEPLFDVSRIPPEVYRNLAARHRNILLVNADPAVSETGIGVAYDVAARPQVVLTLQGPNVDSLTRYLSAHADEVLHVLEAAERDRTIDYGRTYPNAYLTQMVADSIGIGLSVPKGYELRKGEGDFLWISYEFPQASQGFFLYSYPYTGKQDLTPEALVKARNRFAARIPGPSEGSYMTTASVFEPEYRAFRLENRLWIELRGFWDVANDFMGGPFVSYTTVDTRTNRVVTLDGYVYSPRDPKRNRLRELEHLLYLIQIPEK